MIMSETESNPALEDGYQAMANDEDRETEALACVWPYHSSN
jgi:hypothetical protein